MSPKLLELLDPTTHLSYSAYAGAMAWAETCRRRLEVIFTETRRVASAKRSRGSPSLDATGNPLCNRMWTLIHSPAVNLPDRTGPTGLPVGVQVIGPIGMDERLS